MKKAETKSKERKGVNSVVNNVVGADVIFVGANCVMLQYLFQVFSLWMLAVALSCLVCSIFFDFSMLGFALGSGSGFLFLDG